MVSSWLSTRELVVKQFNAWLVPSGLTSVTLTHEVKVELVTRRLAPLPAAVVENVRRAFCPGTVVVTVTAGPPIVIGLVTSWILFNAIVTLPSEVADGLRKIVYVPVAGSVCASMNPPLADKAVDPNTVPSGLRIETVPLPMETALNTIPTRWPAMPSNKIKPFLPAVVIVTVLL